VSKQWKKSETFLVVDVVDTETGEISRADTGRHNLFPLVQLRSRAAPTPNTALDYWRWNGGRS
jgi:hypothetical protein